MGIFLPVYFSIVYKVTHLSDLGLALIMSSRLFAVLFAGMCGMWPTGTLSPYYNIYQLLMRFMGLQRVEHDWATELNWTECDFWNCLSSLLNSHHFESRGHVYHFLLLKYQIATLLNKNVF